MTPPPPSQFYWDTPAYLKHASPLEVGQKDEIEKKYISSSYQIKIEMFGFFCTAASKIDWL